jgi:hypothetical protein
MNDTTIRMTTAVMLPQSAAESFSGNVGAEKDGEGVVVEPSEIHG